MTGMESESVKARYSYDPMGRRKSKTVNGVTTSHIWDKDNIVYETKGDGSKLASYYRGIHLAAIDNGAIDYYLYDNHGDITGMKYGIGEIIYDAFGNQTSDTTGGYNPFRYNSQYTDAESGLIYLRARYYDPSIGRFMAEDPVKDGLNWYAYCAGNPVNFVDPSGLEEIVVSGGRYSYDEDNNFKYNFIEPAIKKLRELKDNNYDGENITWIIADIGWTDEDKSNFANVANDIGVGIQFISNKDELIGYINYKYAGTNDVRVNDLITKFVVFAHGNPGEIMLGFDYQHYNDEFTLTMDDLTTDKIKTFDAFDNPNSAFYSCNTGTDISDEWGSNFAQRWVNLAGGTTWAFIGKTNYSEMNKGESWSNKVLRAVYGFSTMGSKNYPGAGSNAWVNVFWR